jgi:hypothetical protein
MKGHRTKANGSAIETIKYLKCDRSAPRLARCAPFTCAPVQDTYDHFNGVPSASHWNTSPHGTLKT